MKFTPEQIKGRIQNTAKINNADPRTLMRLFMMERFLERLANSKYKDNFIIKGGVLVCAMVGLGLRSTMDIDTSVRNLNLTPYEAKEIINNIINIDLHDGVTFKIKKYYKGSWIRWNTLVSVFNGCKVRKFDYTYQYRYFNWRRNHSTCDRISIQTAT